MDKTAFRLFIFIMSSAFFIFAALACGTLDNFLTVFSFVIAAATAYITTEFLELEYPTFFFDDDELEKHIPCPPSHVRVASAMSFAESTLDADEAERRQIAEDLADFDRRLQQGGA